MGAKIIGKPTSSSSKRPRSSVPKKKTEIIPDASQKKITQFFNKKGEEELQNTPKSRPNKNSISNYFGKNKAGSSSTTAVKEVILLSDTDTEYDEDADNSDNEQENIPKKSKKEKNNDSASKNDEEKTPKINGHKIDKNKNVKTIKPTVIEPAVVKKSPVTFALPSTISKAKPFRRETQIEKNITITADFKKKSINVNELETQIISLDDDAEVLDDSQSLLPNEDTDEMIIDIKENKEKVEKEDEDEEIIKSPIIIKASPRTPTKSPKKRTSHYSPRRHANKSPAKNNNKNSPQKKEFSPRKINFDQDKPVDFDPYYAKNFKIIIDSVVKDEYHQHVLNEEDREMINNFKDMNLGSQCLYIRLFQRKWQWKPENGIKYPQIGENLSMYFKELHNKKFTDEISDTKLELDELLNLLNGEQINILAKKMRANANGAKSKENLIEALINLTKKQSTISGSSSNIIYKNALELLGRACKVTESSKNLFSRICILYSPPMQWEEEDQGSNQLLNILLTNIGKMEYPEYKINKKTHIFKSRDDLISFQESYTRLSHLIAFLENKDYEEAAQIGEETFEKLKLFFEDSDKISHGKSLPSFLRLFTAGSVLTKIVWSSADAFQKLKKYSRTNEIIEFLLNQNIYLTNYRGRWYERKIINLKHLKKSNLDIREIIITAFKDSFVSEANRYMLTQRLDKLKIESPKKKKPKAKKRKRKRGKNVIDSDSEDSDEDEDKSANNLDLNDIQRVILKNDLPTRTIQGEKMENSGAYRTGKSVFISQNSEDSTISSVELFALDYYKTQGYTNGIHGEGCIPVTIFSLLFWDIIYYEEVPDTFYSAFQPFPLDFYTDDFYNQRKDMIDEMLNKIRNVFSLEDIFLILDNTWQNNEGKVSPVNWTVFSSSDQAKSLIKAMGLSVLASLCERFAKNFRYYRSGFPDICCWNENSVLFSEVKGPGDSLSPKQSLWLEYLINCGAKAELCHVKAVSNKRIKTS